MAITTYAELQSSVAAWLNRSDLTALVPDFITLAEERINRALRVQQMQVALSDTIFDGYIIVPANTVGVKTLWIEGHESRPLAARPYEDLLTRGTEGVPTGWAWQGENIYFDGSGDVAGVLYERIAALSEEDTNWLLTAHPSVYLFGALSEAFNYTRNQAERDRWDGRFLQALAEIQGGDMRDRFSGPLQVRAR